MLDWNRLKILLGIKYIYEPFPPCSVILEYLYLPGKSLGYPLNGIVITRRKKAPARKPGHQAPTHWGSPLLIPGLKNKNFEKYVHSGSHGSLHYTTSFNNPLDFQNLFNGDLLKIFTVHHNLTIIIMLLLYT